MVSITQRRLEPPADKRKDDIAWDYPRIDISNTCYLFPLRHGARKRVAITLVASDVTREILRTLGSEHVDQARIAWRGHDADGRAFESVLVITTLC